MCLSWLEHALVMARVFATNATLYTFHSCRVICTWGIIDVFIDFEFIKVLPALYQVIGQHSRSGFRASLGVFP